MQTLIQYEFMQNAILGAFLVSIACGVVGSLIVINKMTFIGAGLSHGAYGGIGIALFLGISPLFGASVFSLALGLFAGFLTLKNSERFDAIIGILWSVGMAIGIIFIDLTPGYVGDLSGYLFGSILAINRETLIFIAIADALFIAIVMLFYRQFCAISFDMEFASLKGTNTRAFYLLLIAMITFCVVSAIQIVGIILIMALITIPPFIAEKFAKTLGAMMAIASLVAATFCVGGLVLSYYANLTASAIIVVIAAASFFATNLVSNLMKK